MLRDELQERRDRSIAEFSVDLFWYGEELPNLPAFECDLQRPFPGIVGQRLNLGIEHMHAGRVDRIDAVRTVGHFLLALTDNGTAPWLKNTGRVYGISILHAVRVRDPACAYRIRSVLGRTDCSRAEVTI